MKAIFPGQCAICNGTFVRGEPIADSGKRGPRGGKKMAHARCVGTRENPYPRRGGMAIPGNYPTSDYEYGPDPQVANWTSYPQYSYEQFYRTNPAPRARQNFFGFGGKKTASASVSPEVADLQEDIKQIKRQIAGAPRNSDLWFDLMGDLNVVERRLEKLLSGARLNPSAAASRPVYEQMPDNAGPYLPQMFPYGQGGRPASYEAKAKKNSGRIPLPIHVMWEHRRGRQGDLMGLPDTGEVLFSREQVYRHQTQCYVPESRTAFMDRLKEEVRSIKRLVGGPVLVLDNEGNSVPGFEAYAKANRGKHGAFLKPSTGSWPVGDRKHAKIAVQYMTRGFGNPAEYPALVKRLADQYPVEDSANRAVWAAYRKNLKGIEAKVGRAMPSMKSLRKRATR